MTDYYTRQHTVANGTTADASEVDDEFDAIVAAFQQVAVDVDAAAAGTESAANAQSAADSAGEAAASALAASNSEDAAAASAQSAADSVSLLAPISTAMPAYSLVARNAGTTGAAAAVQIGSSKMSGLATASGSSATLTIPGDFATLNELLLAARDRCYNDVTIMCAGGTVTDTANVVFPPGIRFRFIKVSGTPIFVVTAGGNSETPAFHIPRGASVSTSGTPGIEFRGGANSGSPHASVLRVDGLLDVATLDTVKLSASNAGGVTRLFNSRGGFVFGTIRLNDTNSLAGSTFEGGYFGGQFTSTGVAPNSVGLTGVTASVIELSALSPTFTVSGGDVSFLVSTGFTASRQLVSASDARVTVRGLSQTVTGDGSLASPPIELARCTAVLSSVSLNIASANAACTKCVSASESRVSATSMTLTGQVGTYGLYGTYGTQFLGSGNTYTTLTASNLTGTWAAGGQYLNA